MKDRGTVSVVGESAASSKKPARVLSIVRAKSFHHTVLLFPVLLGVAAVIAGAGVGVHYGYRIAVSLGWAPEGMFGA